MAHTIRVVDITALAGPAGPERDAADRELGEAAEDMGFLVVTGVPLAHVTREERIAELLRIFSLPREEKQRLLNRRCAPDHNNSYRGFFSSHQPKDVLFSEGYDMGGDCGPAGAADWLEEMLMEHNVWPEEALLPGWRAVARRHYDDMEALGRLMMRAFGRYLGIGEEYFEPSFGGGSSTLRFSYAPPRADLDPAALEEKFRAEIDGKLVRLRAPAHRDSGVLTLLWQPGGLEAQDPRGNWISAPAVPNALTVNFGDCLQFWTGGRLRATPHRVIAQERDRYSIPFFFEPRFDAVIATIPGVPPAPAIRYADHLLTKMRIFGTHATERKGQAA